MSNFFWLSKRPTSRLLRSSNGLSVSSVSVLLLRSSSVNLNRWKLLDCRCEIYFWPFYFFRSWWFKIQFFETHVVCNEFFEIWQTVYKLNKDFFFYFLAFELLKMKTGDLLPTIWSGFRLYSNGSSWNTRLSLGYGSLEFGCCPNVVL